jgi:transposase-like protein
VLAAASAVYRGESESEIRGRLARFREEWGKREPGAVATLEREFDQTLVYLRVLGRARESGEEWREECLRTTSPLEGVQRHLRQKVRQMVIGHSQPGLEAAIYLVIRHRRLVAGQEAADWAAQLEEALLSWQCQIRQAFGRLVTCAMWPDAVRVSVCRCESAERPV